VADVVATAVVGVDPTAAAEAAGEGIPSGLHHDYPTGLAVVLGFLEQLACWYQRKVYHHYAADEC